MKTHLNMLTIVIFVVMSLAGCAAPATQSASVEPMTTQPPEGQAEPTQPPVGSPTPTENPNAEVVLNMVAKLNAGDVDGSLAYFAEDALSYFVGLPPTGMEVYRGAEALRPMWEYCVSDHFEWEVEIMKVEGDLVFANAKTWLDFTRGLGVAPNEFIDIYQVKDGKITTYGSTITGQALSEFKPAFYEVMPPEPTAAPPQLIAASELTVTIADGTCTTDSPAALQTGEVTVQLNVEEGEKELYALFLFNLGPGKDMLDLMASTTADAPPAWAEVLLGEEIGPNQSKTLTFTLEKGPVYMICFSQPPVLPIGNAGPIEVVSAAPTPTPPVRGESDIMLTFANKSCNYEGPPVIPTGAVNVIMNMQGQDVYKQANALVFFTLDSGYDLQDLVDTFWMPSPPEWAHEILKLEAYPGEARTHEVTVEAGPLYYACLSGESEETAKLVGKGGPLEVSP